MNNVTDFDTSKYYLGKLCPRKHNWGDSEQSLRKKDSRGCIECQRLNSRNHQAKIKATRTAPCSPIDALPKVSKEIIALVDTSKYFLGSLCSRDHNWKESGRSLRLIKKGMCVACQNFHSANFLRERRKEGLSQDILIKAADLFWSKVNRNSDSGCWLWQGTKSSKGYGRFCLDGTTIPRKRRGRILCPARFASHRASYRLVHGEISSEELVCHSCDVPLCVNPSHLFLGTSKDNMHDMVAKGRSLKGERHPNSKLTSPQVLEIRRMFADGEITASEICDRYKIKPSTVSGLLQRVSWSWLKD